MASLTEHVIETARARGIEPRIVEESAMGGDAVVFVRSQHWCLIEVRDDGTAALFSNTEEGPSAHQIRDAVFCVPYDPEEGPGITLDAALQKIADRLVT